MTTPLNQVSVFLSYAHEDEAWVKKLSTHLSSLKRQGVISTWDKREIVPGTNQAEVIDQHLEQASIILLLVSANFLASDACYDIEMTRALQRHEAGTARVIPLIIRPTDWTKAPFAHLSPLPTDTRAITAWSNEDEAFVDVVSGLRSAIEDLSFSPASPLRSTLPGIWNIPYPHNPFFVGRDEVLEKLHTQLQTGQATALSQSPYAISGLGGIGKTQIAKEYAHRYHQDYQVVLWARAENQDALISSYTQLATLLKLPARDEGKQEVIIEAVKAWLQTRQKWLLILDNADDLDLLPSFLPPAPGGHVLITTRAWDMQGIAQRLEVETLSDEQGAVLLLRRTGLLTPESEFAQIPGEDRRWATLLAHDLGGLPLALDQAGAYLDATGMSLQDYHELYQTHRQMLLHEEHRSRIADHPAAVAATWSLSFERVQKKNPAAADLLRLCAYFAPDAIAEEILTADASVLGPVLAPMTSDAFQLNQAIEALRAYSLIRRNPREKTLSVHRLVQAVLQDELKEREQQTWAERAMRAINAAFPHAEPGTWSQCERLLMQALTATQLIEEYHFTQWEAGHLLVESASYLQDRARYSEAEPLYQRALRIWEQNLGPEHPEVAYLLNNLANLYYQQGKYAKAELLYQRTLRIREQNLGPEHPNVAYPLNGLANLYKEQSKYAEAEPLYQRALRIWEQSLGPEHPQVATPLNGLAELYRDQGKYAEAEPLYQRALRIREQSLGPEHPEVAYPLNNLAELYRDQGKYAEAEPLYQRALRIWEQSLGPEHPQVTTPLNNLAILYYQQGKYAEVEPLYQRALRIREQSLGPEHPQVANLLNNLATLYYQQGKYAEAEPFYQRALRIWEQNLGPEHPQVANLLNNLANLYYQQGKYAEVEPLYQRALRIGEQNLGPEHPQVATLLNNLANLYYQQGKYAEAEPLYQQALRIREQNLGPEHPNVATPLNNLATLYYQQGKYAEAEPFYQRALRIREQSLGPEHPDVAYPLNGLANLYKEQGKYAEAEPLYQRALRIWEQNLGSEHSFIRQVRKNYAILLRTMGRDEEAKKLEEES